MPSYYIDGLRMADANECGEKGRGLLRLPPAWYPPTLAISVAYHANYKTRPEARPPLPTDSQRHFSDLARASPAGRLFLRSSSASESLAERGQYESYDSASSIGDVRKTIAAVWAGTDKETPAMGVLVQPLLRVVSSGHLSNEYRLCREAATWHLSVDSPLPRKQEMWRIAGDIAADDGALHCNTPAKLINRLRAVAKRLSSAPHRYHLEWVWDGNRLWIVQADQVAPLQGKSPGDAWEPTPGEKISGDLAFWRSIADIETGHPALAFNKVASVQQFGDSDLPQATVWWLSDTELFDEILADRSPQAFLDELRKLCSGHLLVRSDVKNHGDGMMMPKTATALNDVAEVLDYIKSTLTTLRSQGFVGSDVCFLAHRFIRARACAWALAEPRSEIVQVDSTWGLPDGLAWLPHDTASVNLGNDDVSRRINGKSSFLDVSETSSWSYRETPTEWIWRTSATEDQMRLIARGTKALADKLNRPLSVMWFIGLLDGAETECLPWFSTENHVDEQDHKSPSPAAKRAVVRSVVDIDRWASGLIEASVMRLEPTEEMVRDRIFIDRIISLSKEYSFTIEFTGSPLGHPYYMLKKAGLAVVCVNRRESAGSTENNKLVRDRIPDVIRSNGEFVETFRVEAEGRVDLLRRKLVEEALELLRARSKLESAEEIADVEEVLSVLRSLLGISRDQIREIRHRKNAERGSFNEGVVLVRTSSYALDTIPLQDSLPGLDREQTVLRRARAKAGRDGVELDLVPPLAAEPQFYEVQTDEGTLWIRYRTNSLQINFIARPPHSESAPTLF